VQKARSPCRARLRWRHREPAESSRPDHCSEKTRILEWDAESADRHARNTWHPILGMTWIKGNVAIFSQRNDDRNRAKSSECITERRSVRIREECRLHVQNRSGFAHAGIALNPQSLPLWVAIEQVRGAADGPFISVQSHRQIRLARGLLPDCVEPLGHDPAL
jgi:hypothetical protein